MSNLKVFKPQGMLHEGWSAQVDDYAMACGWVHNGEALLVADVTGGLYLFNGLTGQINWKINDIHQEMYEQLHA